MRDPFGNTPLHYAAEGNVKMVELLLSRGALVAVGNDEGSTPLHMAAFGNFASCVSALIKAGAPLEAQDADGATPLHHRQVCYYLTFIYLEIQKYDSK